MFGTVKEGLIGRHLTFVPLAGVTTRPDYLQVAVSADEVKEAPNISCMEMSFLRLMSRGLYHHYEMNYTAPTTVSGRRLARR